MTIKDAILSFPGLSDIPDDFISKVLVDRSIADDGAATYALADKETVALCAADLYVAVIASPDFSEGKFSVKLSRGYMRERAMKLYKDNGETSNADALRRGKGYAIDGWW